MYIATGQYFLGQINERRRAEACGFWMQPRRRQVSTADELVFSTENGATQPQNWFEERAGTSF